MRKKTSVYLDEEHVARLKRAAEAEGRSQAEVLRDAIPLYPSRADQPPRTFAIDAIAPGIASRFGYRSIADIPENELLAGFGETLKLRVETAHGPDGSRGHLR
jgi:hypothetical protein